MKLSNVDLSGATEVEKVERIYDAVSASLLEAQGPIFQSNRPLSERHYVDYLVESIGIKDGMRILDAGCGVCGPSSYFASLMDVMIDAVTISQVQVDIARKRLVDLSIDSRVSVTKGDFHELGTYFRPESYDLVMFLESIGHCHDLEKVVDGAKKILKSGGLLYVKETFLAPVFDEHNLRLRADLLRDLQTFHSYRILNLVDFLDVVRNAGLLIGFVKEKGFTEDQEVFQVHEEIYGMTDAQKRAEKATVQLFETLELQFRKT